MGEKERGTTEEAASRQTPKRDFGDRLADAGDDGGGASERTANLNPSKSNVDRSAGDDGDATEAAINNSHSNIKNL